MWMNFIPALFHAARGVAAEIAKATAHERALYTEVLHNCAWLDALATNAKANDPRFVDAIAALKIEAHEAFLEGQFGETETIAVKTASKGVGAAENAQRGTSEIHLSLALADEADQQVTRDVLFAQGVAYVVHQVTFMRSVAKNRGTLGDLLADVRGGTRAQNLGRVEHAIRKALVDSHPEMAPKAGAHAPGA